MNLLPNFYFGHKFSSPAIFVPHFLVPGSAFSIEPINVTTNSIKLLAYKIQLRTVTTICYKKYYTFIKHKNLHCCGTVQTCTIKMYLIIILILISGRPLGTLASPFFLTFSIFFLPSFFEGLKKY